MSRKRTAPGFTLPGEENFCIRKIDRKYSLLRIPVVGWIKMTRKGGNPWESGTPKQVVLRHDGHRWRAIALYEVEVEEKKMDDGKVLGVDMNARQVATSDGDFYICPILRKKRREGSGIRRRGQDR